MPEDGIDYEALIEAELQAAASTADRIVQKRHLDQAASYAALNEQQQREGIDMTEPTDS